MKKGNPIALLPIGVFLGFYLGLGILFEYVLKIPMGFYNVPIVAAFLVALLTACLQNRKLSFEEKLAVISKLNDLAKQRGQALAQMALQWVLRDEVVTSALIGASVDVRNICAHYGRLYNQTMDDRVILLPKYAAYESDYVFPILLMLKVPAGGHRVYSDMIRGIKALAETFPKADLRLCGFPENWEDVLRRL